MKDDGDARPVAVVTGASRGIGAGLIETFAERGFRVVACARTSSSLPSGATGISLTVDVTDPSAVDRLASEAVDRFGRIDLWVNNAGVLEPIGPLARADPAALHAHVATNLLGVLHGSATFARHVRSRTGGGLLVNVSSGAASTPHWGWAVYGATKAAVDQASETLALEEADAGLRVHALAPGVVDTSMQALIRRTGPEAFPDVERFRALADDGAFNSTGWVGEWLLDHLWAADPDHPLPVRVRVPDQPR